MREKLISTYQTLTVQEQRILQALSIIFEPIGQTRFQDTIQLSQAFSAGVSNLINKSLRLRLLELNLIDVSPAGWRCKRSIMEYLIREAAKDPGFFTKINAASISPHIGFNPMNQHFRKIKELRVALYQGKVKNFISEFQKFRDQYQEYMIDTLKLMFFEHFDTDWFNQLDPVIRMTVTSSYLEVSRYNLLDCDLQYRLLLDDFEQFGVEYSQFLPAYMESRLIRGDLDDLEHIQFDEQNSTHMEKKAMLCFLQNRNEQALQYFQAEIKLIKKQTRKRNVFLSGYAGLFYSLALFKSRSNQDLALLKTQIKHSAKQGHWQNIFTLAQERLLKATEILGMKTNLDDPHSFILFRRYNNPYDSLLYILLHHWLNELDRVVVDFPDIIECLNQDCIKAERFGYHWYAAVCSQFLVRYFNSNKDVNAIAKQYRDSGFTELIDWVPHVDAWQRALDALTLVADKTSDVQANETGQQALRMVWTVSIANQQATLAPREQKRNKNGAWTKGRAVALKRLYDDPDSFEYLTEQDRRICNHIKKNSDSYRSHYYYREDSIELEPQAVCEAIGHPHIYWSGIKSYNQPVQIVEGQLQLLVSEQDEHLQIALAPFPDPDEIVLAEKTATGDLLVYKVDKQHLQVAEILGITGLTVPKSAKQQVIDSISAIASVVTVQSDIDGQSSQVESVSPDSRIHVHLQPLGEGLLIEFFVQPFQSGGPVYKPSAGGVNVLAEIDGKSFQTKRDLEQEQQYLDQALQQCGALSVSHDLKWTLDDPETALETLLQLQQMEDFMVLEWPKGKAIKIGHEKGLTSALFSVRKERDWLSVTGGIQLDDGQVLEMQKLIGLLSTSPGRFLKLEDGHIIALTHDLRQRLDDLQGLGDLNGKDLRLHALAAPTVDELTDGMEIKAAKSWQRQIQTLQQAADFKPEIPSTLQGELREYQVQGYQWLSRLAYIGAGACLADDMGLGKTVQALALILSRAADGPTLIIAPTSVCNNWLEEAQRFAPTLNAMYFGTGNRQQLLADAGALDLVVCSYGLLQTEAEMLIEKTWHTIVADEAQAIKNPQTQRSKAAMALSGNFKVVTTGTPIENHLGELWNLFNFINPGLLGSMKKFNERFAAKIENQQDYVTQQRLKRLLQPFILRRLKNDVLTELPSRTEVTLHVELSEKERLFYEAMRRTAQSKMDNEIESEIGHKQLQVLAEIMKLRRTCCHPKLVLKNSEISSSKLLAFEELVEELIGNRHKALVFSQFVDHLALIRELLDNKGISYQYLDGSTSMSKRKKAVNAFQAGEGDLFLISLKAGGAGLNLTAADFVVHMDPWWNPAVEDQASDRAHRMGQKRPVTIYRLVAKDTIEDKIVELHRHKRDLANSLLEGGDVSGKMSIQDMLELLRGMEG